MGEKNNVLEDVLSVRTRQVYHPIVLKCSSTISSGDDDDGDDHDHAFNNASIPLESIKKEKLVLIIFLVITLDLTGDYSSTRLPVCLSYLLEYLWDVLAVFEIFGDFRIFV